MRVWQDNMEHGTMPDAKPAACARVLCRTFLRVMLAVHVLLLCACTDSPLDPDTITKDVYLQIIANAKDYVWIMTPYLVPDSTFIATLKMAAESGVDVRIITPHYPDKKSVFEVTRSNYLPLLEAGVRIYEYTPGFIHSKTFIADDEVAIVGTTNIDYRSFYLHFELSVLFVLSSIVSNVKDDFLKTFDMSEEQSAEKARRIGPVKRLVRYFLRLFSPAL